jgi:valyl-tRNA synthetase
LKEKEKTLKEIERVENKLNNESFVSKAPEKIINAEREKGEKYKAFLSQIEERLSVLNSK